MNGQTLPFVQVQCMCLKKNCKIRMSFIYLLWVENAWNSRVWKFVDILPHEIQYGGFT